jgi:gluconokinase
VIIIMGVSGSGKTTDGVKLAAALGWDFLDADDFHSAHNIELMRSGVGLTDADRAPWLAALRDKIASVIASGRHAVLACSALKAAYRAALTPTDAAPGAIRFVYLRTPPAVLHERLEHRVGHFAPPALLHSQLDALEEPPGAIWVDGKLPPDEIVAQIRRELSL